MFAAMLSKECWDVKRRNLCEKSCTESCCANSNVASQRMNMMSWYARKCMRAAIQETATKKAEMCTAAAMICVQTVGLTSDMRITECRGGKHPKLDYESSDKHCFMSWMARWHDVPWSKPDSVMTGLHIGTSVLLRMVLAWYEFIISIGACC